MLESNGHMGPLCALSPSGDGLGRLGYPFGGQLEGSPSRFEVGMPVPQVGLEVAALRPLVPGIQEHDPMAARLEADTSHGFPKPFIVAGRSRVVDDDRAASHPWGVVPSWEN